jgi:hypothetical protein
MKPQRSEAMAVNIDPQKWNFHPSMCSIALTHKEHPMTPEEVIRLAAVDVRERPEDEPTAPAVLGDEILKLLVRIRQLEQERDEAVDMIGDWYDLAKDAKPDCGGIGDGYLIAPMKEIEFRLLREASATFLAAHPPSKPTAARPQNAVNPGEV